MASYSIRKQHRRDRRRGNDNQVFRSLDDHDGPFDGDRDRPRGPAPAEQPRAQVHGYGRAPRYPPPQGEEAEEASHPRGHYPEASGGVARPSPGGLLQDDPRHPGLYRQRDASSTSTVDMEMVEMRHPERAGRLPPRHAAQGQGQGQGQGFKPRYAKSPSSDSVLRSAPRPIRASAYSTLSMKSWGELDTEVSSVTKDLHEHFKPIFDKHGEEGVLVKKLQEELNSRRSQHLLGRHSIAERLQLADRDGDEYLSYGDFVSMILQDLRQERKLAFRGMLLSALGGIGILPKEKRDNFLASYKLCPPPLFILIITLIQVIIFAVYVADMEERGMVVTANSGYPHYSPLHYTPQRRWEAWRFLTYMFVHDGYLHIVFNVVGQLLFGYPLEMVHSWWRTAIIYITGVAAGSLAHSVVDPVVGLVGASGGVYAILGAHLAAVITNWKEMNYKLCDQEEFDNRPCCALSRIFISAPVRLGVVALLVLSDTGLAIVRRVALDEQSKVGVSAHVGGFLTGLLLGIPVLRNVNKHAWETHLGWVSLVVFLAVCAFAVFFNAFYDDRYPPTDWS